MKRRGSLRQRGGVTEEEQDAARLAEQAAELDEPNSANNKLPNGWSSAENNDGSGDIYYYNNSSPPFTTRIKPTMSAVNARAARLPNGWSSAKNEDGDIYYYNNSTPQFTTRNKPIMSSVNARALAQNPAAPVTLVRNVDARVALARNAAVNAGATNTNAEVVANVVAGIVNKAVEAANEKGTPPAAAANAAKSAAVNAAVNAGASKAVAKAAASAAVSAVKRPPPSLSNYTKERITRERGAKIYEEIQAGTKTATPAQQGCITKYEACKTRKQAGGSRMRKRNTRR